MSSYSQDSHVVYVPAIIKLPQTEESPKQYRKDATTQTETTTASASKTNSAASTIDSRHIGRKASLNMDRRSIVGYRLDTKRIQKTTF